MIKFQCPIRYVCVLSKIPGCILLACCYTYMLFYSLMTSIRSCIGSVLLLLFMCICVLMTSTRSYIWSEFATAICVLYMIWIYLATVYAYMCLCSYVTSNQIMYMICFHCFSHVYLLVLLNLIGSYVWSVFPIVHAYMRLYHFMIPRRSIYNLICHMHA